MTKTGDRVGNRDTSQASAFTECLITNTCDRIGNGSTRHRQVRTTTESIMTNTSDRIGDGDTRQVRAISESNGTKSCYIRSCNFN